MPNSKRSRNSNKTSSRNSLISFAGNNLRTFEEFPSARQVGRRQTLSTNNTPTVYKSSRLSLVDSYKCKVQVVVRLRGRNQLEKEVDSTVVINQAGSELNEIKVDENSNGRTDSQVYRFDSVSGPEVNQSDFFVQTVTPYIDDLLNGINCTLFAYGQTGTGKTYTMEGDLNFEDGQLNSNAGIIPRTLKELFYRMNHSSSQCTLKISMMEIYCEEVKDLLVKTNGLPIKLYNDTNGVLHIQNLLEISVESVNEALELISKGAAKRRTSSTLNNSKSSRSHSIVSLTLTSKTKYLEGLETITEAKLCLVDLAGSESAKTSGAINHQAREASQINTSLLSLGQCINTLANFQKSVFGSEKPFIPVRNSKLTRILEDSLTGSTKTCIIATISPVLANLDETISTLKYASNAMRISTKPIFNKRVSPAEQIQDLKDEVKVLQKRLQNEYERNGIYLNNEDYNNQVEELKRCKEELEATRKSVSDLIQVKNDSARQNVELQKRLAITEKNLDTQISENVQLQEDLSEANRKLEIIQSSERTAQEKSHHYYSRLSEMESTLKKREGDLEIINSKFESQQNESLENAHLVCRFKSKIEKIANHLKSKIEVFEQEQNSLISGLKEANKPTEAAMDEFLTQFYAEATSKMPELQPALDKNSNTVKSIYIDSEKTYNQMLEDLTTLKAKVVKYYDYHQELVKKLDEHYAKKQTEFTKQVVSLQEDLQRFLLDNKEAFMESLEVQRTELRRVDRRVQRDAGLEQDFLGTQATDLQYTLNQLKQDQPTLISNFMNTVQEALQPLFASANQLQEKADKVVGDLNTRTDTISENASKTSRKLAILNTNLDTLNSQYLGTNQEVLQRNDEVMNQLQLSNQQLLTTLTNFREKSEEVQKRNMAHTASHVLSQEKLIAEANRALNSSKEQHLKILPELDFHSTYYFKLLQGLTNGIRLVEDDRRKILKSTLHKVHSNNNKFVSKARKIFERQLQEAESVKLLQLLLESDQHPAKRVKLGTIDSENDEDLSFLLDYKLGTDEEAESTAEENELTIRQKIEVERIKAMDGSVDWFAQGLGSVQLEPTSKKVDIGLFTPYTTVEATAKEFDTACHQQALSGERLIIPKDQMAELVETLDQSIVPAGEIDIPVVAEPNCEIPEIGHYIHSIGSNQLIEEGEDL